MPEPVLLTSIQMAEFVARGFLRFDAVVPDEINEQFMAEAGEIGPPSRSGDIRVAFRRAIATNRIPEVRAGTPLIDAYPTGSALRKLIELPVVSSAIRSLQGHAPIFDHHFLHVTFPPHYYRAADDESVSQPTHQDSTIDPRRAFDIQLMYFPHAVTKAMGGTRFIPGTHLRKVSEMALARYQNMRGQQHVVCDAGTLLIMHHGIWHGAGVNRSDQTRYMFKIRIQPGSSQVRCWNLADAEPAPARPIFYRKTASNAVTVESLLTTPESWFEDDTGRLEYINRIKLWRYLSDNPSFDADYWMTRLETGN